MNLDIFEHVRKIPDKISKFRRGDDVVNEKMRTFDKIEIQYSIWQNLLIAEVGKVQRNVYLVDLEKCGKTRLLSIS